MQEGGLILLYKDGFASSAPAIEAQHIIPSYRKIIDTAFDATATGREKYTFNAAERIKFHGPN